MKGFLSEVWCNVCSHVHMINVTEDRVILDDRCTFASCRCIGPISSTKSGTRCRNCSHEHQENQCSCGCSKYLAPQYCKECSHYHHAQICYCGCVLKEENNGRRDIIKPRYSDIPMESLREIVLVFSQGAAHYGVSNWKNGLDIIDVFNHMDEHLHHWVKTFDEGEGHSCELCNKEYVNTPVRELAKVAWGCLIIIWYYYCRRDVYESGRGK